MTPETARVMARHDAGQNRSMIDAAETLGPEAREADLGAFFGWIRATFSHLLWADRMWMSRLSDWERPEGGPTDARADEAGWTRFVEMRAEVDARLVDWAEGLAALDGPLSGWSGSVGREVTRPRALCALHMFNHQTHHRGQIHAMLTAAGARPGVTDLAFMP